MMKFLALLVTVVGNIGFFTVGGGLVFFCVGLLEGVLVGMLLTPLANLSLGVSSTELVIGGSMAGMWLGGGGGALAFFLGGVVEGVAVLLGRKKSFMVDYDFDRCVSAAFFASAVCGVAGALSGAMLGALWQWHSPSARASIPQLALFGLAAAAGLGYFIGLVLGATAPDTVQTARARAGESWRQWRGTQRGTRLDAGSETP